jgi:hypothetical protein
MNTTPAITSRAPIITSVMLASAPPFFLPSILLRPPTASTHGRRLFAANEEGAGAEAVRLEMTTCTYCGRPTDGKTEFFKIGSELQPAHFDCILLSGRRLPDSGAIDDVRRAVKWPDGPAEITTGKRLREGKPPRA